MKCNYDDMKKGGEIHKTIKEYIYEHIELDMNLYDLAIDIESKIEVKNNFLTEVS